MFDWFKKKKSTSAHGPDFSAVDSANKAEEMFRAGQLEKLFLLPPQFGGEDTPQNIVYVPIGLASVKEGIDTNIVASLVTDGKVTQYSAKPEYQGKSFIPIAIHIRAWNPGNFTTTIEIWGDALERK